MATPRKRGQITVSVKPGPAQHPENLTAKELSLRIVSDAGDAREVETAAQAIRGLREFGLFKVRDDEIVEPTPAGLRAVALLT